MPEVRVRTVVPGDSKRGWTGQVGVGCDDRRGRSDLGRRGSGSPTKARERGGTAVD